MSNALVRNSSTPGNRIKKTQNPLPGEGRELGLKGNSMSRTHEKYFHLMRILDP